MAELYLGTQALVDALIAHGIQVRDVEPHDADDAESADRIWLERDTSGGMCEGEYLFVEQSTYNDSEQIDMFVGYNSANICGGHPTYWTKLLPAGDCGAIQSLVLEHWPVR